MNLLWTELRKDAKGLREIGRWYRAEMMESAANEIDRLNDRIKRLEEAGDAMASWAKASPDCHYLFHSDERSLRVNNWIKAKEDKP